MNKKKASPLMGLRVLVVENEALVGLLVEDFLKGFGCKTVGIAASTTDALGLIQSEAIDAAVIDVKLEGEMAYPLAAALKIADVPFVFATGVLADEIDGGYAHVPVVGKPFEEGELRGALLKAIDGRVRRRQA
jgi:DNA-binding response OmpR family regulator